MQEQENDSMETKVIDLLMATAGVSSKRSNQYLSHRYGLTLPQYQLLLAAVHHDSRTLGHLADDLACSRGNLTGVADRLERDGWIERERSREDRRVVNIRLTEKGKTITQIRTELNTWLAGLTRHVAPEEAAQLLQALDKLRAQLENRPVPSGDTAAD